MLHWISLDGLWVPSNLWKWLTHLQSNSFSVTTFPPMQGCRSPFQISSLAVQTICNGNTHYKWSSWYTQSPFCLTAVMYAFVMPIQLWYAQTHNVPSKSEALYTKKICMLPHSHKMGLVSIGNRVHVPIMQFVFQNQTSGKSYALIKCIHGMCPFFTVRACRVILKSY